MKKNATKMNGLVIAGAVERERERERESYSLIAGKGAGFIELCRISRVFLLLIVIFLGVFVVGVGESFGADTASQEKTCTKDGICYKYTVEDGKAKNVTIDPQTSNIPDNKEIKIPEKLGDCNDCNENSGNGYQVESIGNGKECIVGEHKPGTSEDQYNKIEDFKFSNSFIELKKGYPKFVLPTSVKKIENNAFDHMLVSSENFDKLESIGEHAFQACIIVNKDNDGSFSNKQKLQLTNIKSIGKEAFCSQSSSSGSSLLLRGFIGNIQGYNEIEFGNNITKICEGAFCGNRALETVKIPNKVTEIEKGAFKNCRGIKTLTFEGRCDGTECEDVSRSTSNDKLKIGDYAFKGTGITEVEINDKLELKEGVFSSCTKLKTATVKVTKIPDRTFAGSALEELTFSNDNGDNSDNNNKIEIGKEALAGTQITSENYKKLMQKVTKVGDGAFSSCDKLTGKIEVPNTITELGIGVFKDCKQITEGEVKKVKDTKLPASTFENCTGLTSVQLPEGLTEIGDSAFKNCTALNMDGIKKIVKEGEECKECKVTKIGNSSFENCTGLEGDLKLPESVKEIGNNAFEGCSKISGDLEIKKVTNIGEDAFKDCTGITGTITIGEDTTSEETGKNGNGTITIGKNAFKNCEGAQKVEIKGQVETIGEFAFYNTATKQNVVDIESNVKSAGTRILTKPDEIFIKSKEQDLKGEFRWFGDGKPIIHYGDCKHAVQVECYIPGVKIIEVKQNGEKTQNDEGDNCLNNKIKEVDCKSTFKFKIDKGSSYNGEVIVKLISEGEKSDSGLVEQIIYPDKENAKTNSETGAKTTIVKNEEGDIYTIEKLTRDQKIVVLTKEQGTNLVLKAFASEVNGKTIGYNQRRSPVVNELKTTGIKGFSYNQTKVPLAVKKGDIVTYTIRVYNEGNKEGEANEITVRLPERLKLVDDSEINKLYKWKLDGEEDSEGNQGGSEGEKPTEQVNDDWQTLEGQANAGDSSQKTSDESSEELKEEKDDKEETKGNGVKVYKTTYLAEHKIQKYSGKGKPEYQDVQIQCKVPNAEKAEDYLVLVAEISDGNDNNSVQGNAEKLDVSGISKEEGKNTLETEDDTDYETIQVNGSTKLEYELVVKKIDGDKSTLLDGAKIRLYDKDKKVLEEVVTKGGEANFGKFVTSGVVREREGNNSENKNEIDSDIKDIYYIEEVETPMGYKRTIDGMIKIQVIVNKDKDGENAQPVIICDFDGISEDVEAESSVDYIPIKTKDELKNIGKNNSGATEQAEDKGLKEGTGKSNKKLNYKLEADIDLGNEVWTPINMEGTFDGNNHTISNVKLPSVSTDGGETTATGFFGTYSGTIKNLKLENVTVGDSTSANPAAKSEDVAQVEKSGLAGLVGYMKEGTIEGCTVTFTIEKDAKTKENIGGIIGATGKNGLVNVKDSKGILKFNNGSSGTQINNVGAIIGYVGGNAIITECSNDGSSYSSSLNSGIGGFVGYSAANGRVEFEKCTNKIEKIQAKENVGGIIGCAIGSLAIDECSNEGQVGQTAVTQTVGGLVGYAAPTGYQPKNINVDYQEGKVTVYLSNKETTDEYKINILKVCKLKGVDSPKALQGAKFVVYKYDENNKSVAKNSTIAENSASDTDEKINPNYKLIETQETSADGTITIDNIPMTSLTNDVYYIKEIEAPEGYDILVKDYIRVQLKAKWDGVNERYIIDPEITLSDKISDEEIKKLDSNKGDTENNIKSSEVVKWNNLTIANSTNKGTIEGKQQVGGIVGLTKGLAVIENCHNKSNIEKGEESKEGTAENGQVKAAVAANVTENKISIPFGGGNVGGIIGDAIPSGKDDLVEVIKCSNEIDIAFINADYNVGGIIGSAPVNVEIIGCENKGNINGGNGTKNVNVGGILGASYSRAKIEDCKVTGEITGGKQTTGGILGSATYTYKNKTNSGWEYESTYGFDIENTYLEINNCTVKDSKIGKTETNGSNVPDNAGGIVGQSEALENVITDCTVENTTIESSSGKNGAIGRNSRNIYWGRVYGGRK